MSVSYLNNLLLANRGNATVAFCADQTVCWAQFLADIRCLVVKLKQTECCSIAICCDDSYYFAVAFFAVAYADKKMVLPGNHQPAMLSTLFENGCFDLLIDDGLVVEDLIKNQIKLPLADYSVADFCFSELKIEEVEITLFSSGSSGAPKAISKTLFMLNEEIKALEQLWGELLADSRIVSTVSHQHIYGLLFRVLWPLCASRAFLRKDLVYPEQVIASATDKYTLISSPALLKRLQEGAMGNGYCAVFSSGGPLSADASDLCKSLLKQSAFEVFGSTETGGIGYRQQLEAHSAWTFFDQVTASLATQNCLSLKSPWISYENSDCYQSSDQCELLENNQFVLKGRVDRIVKIEEKRISLVEIETRLNELEWIQESAVLVIDEGHRLSVASLLCLNQKGAEKVKEIGKGKFWICLRHALRLWLEPVGMPRHFRIVDEIPVNKQGKRLHSDISALFSNINKQRKS